MGAIRRAVLEVEPCLVINILAPAETWLLTHFASLALGLAAVGIFGVTPTDSATHISAAALLLFVASGATFIPAWRASGVDPLVALRKD